MKARKAWLLLITFLAMGSALAQIQRSFTTRYSTNTRGNITLIGNTSMTCSTTAGTNSGSCVNARDRIGSVLNNNSFTMIYVDADSDPSTFSSSSADLLLPAGSTVLWAGLYWGGDSSQAQRNTVRFRPPGHSTYIDLTAAQLDVIGQRYLGFVEVTPWVSTSGNGTYWVGNVRSTPNTGDRYAGWALVVVYHNPTEPLRHLNVFDGYARVNVDNNSVSTTVSGFLTPSVGPVILELGTVAFEGDLGSVGDSLRLNGTNVSDSRNPSNDFFNSTISRYGTHVTSKNPNYINQLGFDIDLVSLPGFLPNDASSANVSFITNNDAYFPGVLTFSVNIYAPDLETTFQKSANDLNGGQVAVGDELEFQMSFQNTGGDGATNVVLTDPIPPGTQYVPGSLQVVQNATGASTGTFTDASGDDIAEYSPSCPEHGGNPCVRFRLGSSANATQGGLIPPNQGAAVRFRVRILPEAAGQTVTNTAQVSYNSQTLGTSYTKAATVSVDVNVSYPPTLAKTFSPDTIPPGNPSTLTLTPMYTSKPP